MGLDQDVYAEGETRQEDAGFAADDAIFPRDPVIDVEAEELEAEAAGTVPPRPNLAERFNTETTFQGLSLSQLAVHSLWIVDYLRQLSATEMADGDIDNIGDCADDLESAIMMMFQLAGGTRQELRQRYLDLKHALQARQRMTIDPGYA